MDKWLNFLESLDGAWQVPLLALLAACAAGYFLYSAWVTRIATTDTKGSRSMSLQSNETLLQRVQQVRERWTSERKFVHVLLHGPERGGVYKDWFSDELKICRDFKGEIDAIGSGHAKAYPRREIEYLKIVDEMGRRPKPLWVWALLLLMMVAEAYGLSTLLAGYLNDSGSATQDGYVALAICVLISGALLGFAYFVGLQMYKHGYARRAWKDANGQLRREADGANGSSVEVSKSLDLGDNDHDSRQRQATRIANRSEYVSGVACSTKGEEAARNKVPAFTPAFWCYVGLIALFGMAILVFRVSAINDNFASELRRAQELAAVEAPAQAATQGATVRPALVEDNNTAADKALTQESLERTKSTKIIVTVIYTLLFWMVQTLAVVMSERFGFASDKGEVAYRTIQSFHRQYGQGLHMDEYEALQANGIANAKREALAMAASTLQNWQLGLQTEYRSGNAGLNESQRQWVENSLNAASERSFERFLALSAMTPDVAVLPPDQVPAVPVVAAVPAPPVPAKDPALEFYQRSAAGGETLEMASLAQLRDRVADAELDAAALMVRVAGEPGLFKPYREFLLAMRGALA